MNAVAQASLWAAATCVAAALYRRRQEGAAPFAGASRPTGDGTSTGLARTAAGPSPGAPGLGDGCRGSGAGSAERRGRRLGPLILRRRRASIARTTGTALPDGRAVATAGVGPGEPGGASTGPAGAPEPGSRPRGLVSLSRLVASLAVPVAAAGLWPGRPASRRTFVTQRGDTVELFGRGLYRDDTVFAAAGQRATDAVVLTAAVPLLLAAARRYRRGSLPGHLLLVGTLATFVYVYGSAALGTVAYNPLFLAYVALFAASLWAFALAFATVDRRVLAARLAGRPRGGPAALMLASGAVTTGIWAGPLIAAVRSGRTPERLDSYSTPVTQALDLAVIAPAALVAGVGILRRDPLGYLVASSLLVLEVMLAPLIAAQTASQLAAGIRFPRGQLVGPIAGFVALALAAGRTLGGLLRAVAEVPTPTAP